MDAGELECEVVTTRSGARAMLDRVTGEIMHPVVGPNVEATSLYVEPSRLRERLSVPGATPLVLFDVGLGAGSNAIAAWKVSEGLGAHARRLEIVSFDRSLEALRLASQAEFAPEFGFAGEAGVAARALLTECRYATARTDWRCTVGSLPGCFASETAASVDIIFWDPFSPGKNPELWTTAAFAALRRLCRSGATLHTYGGATATRTAMLLAGFAVGLGAATAAARRTTIAAADVADLACPLDHRWLLRVARSSAPFPSDAPPDAMERLQKLQQLAPSD